MDRTHDYLYFSPTMSAALQFLHGFHYPHCRAVVEKDFSYHSLQFMAEGTVLVSYDAEAHELVGAWCWPAYPGPRVRFRSATKKAWNHRYVAFLGVRTAEWRTMGILPAAPQSIPADQVEPFSKRFDRLLTTIQQPGTLAHARAVNLLEDLLLELAELRGPSGPDSPVWLGHAVDAIEDLNAEDHYEQTAQQSGMALSTFRRKFREHTGMSPHAYRLACQSAEARRLLGETDLPIKVIADRLGYSDVFYFSRQFKDMNHVAPGAFRRTRQSH